jgi:hypothetical protein
MVVHMGDLFNEDQITQGGNYSNESWPIEMPCATDFSVFSSSGPDLDTTTQNGTIIPDDIWGTDPLTSPYVSLGSDGATPCLTPGSYGDFDLGADHVLRLTSGTYFFMSFKSKKGLNLELDLGGTGNCEECSGTDPEESGYTTQSDIWIFVEGQVVIGNMLEGSVISLPAGVGVPADAAKYVYAECHYQDDPNDSNDYGWIMGQNTFWYGTIYVPFASLAITDGDIYGALYSGGEVEIHGGAVSPGPGLPNYDTQINYVKSNYARCVWTYPSDYYDPPNNYGSCPLIASPGP